ncbi:MAG: hypothetical protein OXL34_04430 [Gemmatimonadota bacterium]|nr:hypothetical protein [Gemmatimonadota bacterium]
MPPMPAEAQEVVEIGDDIGCPSCLVETGPPVTLAAPGDGIWFSSLSGLRVARDSEGNYIAAPVKGDALIAVFGPDGRYRSSYGRIGGGPGEFATDIPLLIAVGDGDVLYAIDPVHIHTLAPRAEAGLDQARMPVELMGDAVALQSGIAVEAAVRTEPGVSTIQLLRPDGTIVRSIGAAGTGSRTAEFGVRYALGRSNDRMDVWTAPTNRFHITRYGPDGEAKTRIERTSTLFRPGSSFRPGAPFQAPANTAVTGIIQDGDGLLWIAITRPPRSFSPLARPGRPGQARGLGEEVMIPASVDLNRFLHTTVEVLDPVAGTVVARRDFDEHVGFVRTTDDDVLVYSLRVGPLGGSTCMVTPLALQRG